MNRVNVVMKMHFTDRFSWFYLPWLILGLSFIVNFIISMFIDEVMFVGGIASIYIYMLVMGIIVLAQNFPFAIGLSIRRKDFIYGTMLANGIASIYMGIMLVLLSLIEKYLIVGWGSNLYFFNLPYLTDGSIFANVVVNTCLMLFSFYIGFVISSIYRRLGLYGMYAFFLIIGVLVVVSAYVFTSFDMWRDIGMWFVNHTMFEVALWLIPLTLVGALFSYVLLRRATV